MIPLGADNWYLVPDHEVNIARQNGGVLVVFGEIAVIEKRHPATSNHDLR